LETNHSFVMRDYNFLITAVLELGEMHVTYSGGLLYHTLTDIARVTL
jgi:hypothetical protein